MTLNLKKYERELKSTWQDFTKEKKDGSWVLYGFEGRTYNLIHLATGDGGIEEFVEELSDGRCMYGGVSIKDPRSELQKVIFIIWHGSGVPEQLRGKISTFLGDIKSMFRGYTLDIFTDNEEELRKELLEGKLSALGGSTSSTRREKRQTIPDAAASQVKIKISPADEIRKARECNKSNNQNEKDSSDSETSRPTSIFRAREAAAITGRGSLKAKAATFEAAIFEHNSPQNERAVSRSSVLQKPKAEDLFPTKPANVDTHPATVSSYKKVDPKAELEALRQQKTPHSIPIPSSVDEVIEKPPKDLGVEFQSISSRKQIVNAMTQGFISNSNVEITPREPSTPPLRDLEPIQNKVTKPHGEIKTQKTFIKALYTYEAQEQNEISFEEDDMMELLEKDDDGWWLVLHDTNGKGYVPSNYFEIVSSTITLSQLPKTHQAKVEQKTQDKGPKLPKQQSVAQQIDTMRLEMVTLYDYDENDEIELSFKEGEILTIVEKPDDDWWVAENSMGQKGHIPANYVEAITTLTSKQPPQDDERVTKPTKMFDYKAQHEYLKEDKGELTIYEGQLLSILEKDSNGWWLSENESGEAGWVPSNFLAKI